MINRWVSRFLEASHLSMDAVFSVLYPEDLAWRNPAEWQQILQQLPYTEQLALRGNITEDIFCDMSHFERGAGFLWYKRDNLAQKLILRGKFSASADPEILTRLSKEAAYEMLQTDFLEDIDLILPIPLHPRRLRERGFNQAEYIARAISEVSGIAMSTTNLSRTRHNKHQANLGKSARAQNAEGLFSINHPEELKGLHVLLVDDVITTGNTMRSCMMVLEHVRGIKISVFALAKAR